MNNTFRSIIDIDLAPDVAMCALAALREAGSLRRPGLFALLVTSEVVCIVRRDALADEYHGLGLFKLARAIARRPTTRDELLVIAIGDCAPRLKSIPLFPIRCVFAAGDLISQH